MALALGSTPAECLRPAATDADRRAQEIGRAAFRSPLLLGGVAARSGLSCDSCHRAGHGNPDFQFPGVSGPPGTADVTNSLLSSHRGDSLDNPRPIPNLSGPKAALKVDQAAQSHALEAFIRGLIVEEFDGPEPTPATLDGLASYVRALEPAACPPAPRSALSVASLMDDARRALTAADEAAASGDFATAAHMAQAARGRLGLIDERFSDPALSVDRRRLRGSDGRLAQIQAALRAERASHPQIARWIAQSHDLERALARQEGRSLFSPERLGHAARPTAASVGGRATDVLG
jgi:hypothetical protein